MQQVQEQRPYAAVYIQDQVGGFLERVIFHLYGIV